MRHVLVTSLILLHANFADAASQYSITLLPPAQNAASAIPNGLSPFGVVGGSISVNINGTTAAQIATLWQGQQATLLDTPPGYVSSAVRINASGDAVGALRDPNSLNAQPALWHNGQLQVLPTATFPGGRAWDINNQGIIVGEVSDSPSAVFQPAMWNAGQLSLLGNLPNSQAWAPAINNQGQALMVAASDTQTQTWLLASGVMTPITSPTSDVVSGVELNDHATVAGNTVRLDSQSNGVSAGFIWQDGVFSMLPDIPGDISSAVSSINNGNQIVGIGTRDTGTHALLWQNSQVYDLNTLIPANSGWNLQEATAIADDGTIIGYGTFNGQTQAFLLTPIPEPATLLALLTGAILLPKPRQRKTLPLLGEIRPGANLIECRKYHQASGAK